MAGGVLQPRDVGPADTARVLAFLNGVTGQEALAETIGLSDGLSAGRRVAGAILAARDTLGRFRSLDEVLSVTGVTLGRFTEIVTALSSARPAPSGGTLRLLASTQTPWLGATVTVAAQLLDGEGRGVPSARVGCVASDGDLSAREGLETQTGGAVSLTTEPGGVVRFSLVPRLYPPLGPAAAAALAAELSRLDATAPTPGAAQKDLLALAERYRAEGSGALREAIDRLFETYPAAVLHASAPWPIRPLSLIAFAERADGAAGVVATLTLRLRNWLGGFYAALRETVENDARFGAALKNLDAAAAAGLDLSRPLVHATQAFAGLERGALGARMRDASAGKDLGRFLDTHARTLAGQAVVNSVRAAGASSAAIAAGGFAVYEAIRSVQSAGTAATDVKLGGMQAGLGLVDQRLATLEAQATRPGDLDTLRTEILQDIDAKLADVTVSEVSRADLDALRDELTRDFDTRLSLVEAKSLTRAEFDTAISGLKTDLVGQIDATAQMLSTQINAKADTATVAGLQTSLVQVQADRSALVSRIDTLDQRVSRTGPATGPGIGPITPITPITRFP